MANRTIYLRDGQTAELIPIKLFDKGDGTYSLSAVDRPDFIVADSTAMAALTSMVDRSTCFLTGTSVLYVYNLTTTTWVKYLTMG